MKKIISILMIAAFVAAPAAYAADTCSLAKEIASKAMQTFDKDQKKGLAGLVQAQKLCPDDSGIAYNLGSAYYKYNRPDLAYETWSALAKSNSGDAALLTNLGWLALKLGKTDQARAWAGKTLEKKRNSKAALALMMKVLFQEGKYGEALDFAMSNSGVPAESKNKAAEYVQEQVWSVFRSGRKEDAAKQMMTLAEKYPGTGDFRQAKDRMVMALLDDTADIPLPKPLPHMAAAQGGGIATPQSAESEVLNIAGMSQTQSPCDDAYALIVGIRKYKHIQGPRFADHDARQVQRLITKLGGFKNDNAHIRLRRDREATIGALYGDIQWLTRKARLNPDAKVMFYFSGHGSPVLGSDRQTIKDGLLIPYEADLDNLNDRTAISLAYLKKEFAGLKNDNVVTIIDACFSGSGKSASGMKLIKPKVDTSMLASSKLFISAAAADRPAEEYSPGRQGAFTYFFLDALMGKGDADNDGWVDSVEAFNHAKSKLAALGLEQNPQMTQPVRMRLSRIR